MIWNNQVLEGKDKFRKVYLREAYINPFAQPPHIIKSREVVLWTSSYRRVILRSGLLDRNGEITVQTGNGSFEGVELDNLLWVEHFSNSSPVNHNLRRCSVTVKERERFAGVRK